MERIGEVLWGWTRRSGCDQQCESGGGCGLRWCSPSGAICEYGEVRGELLVEVVDAVEAGGQCMTRADGSSGAPGLTPSRGREEGACLEKQDAEMTSKDPCQDPQR